MFFSSLVSNAPDRMSTAGLGFGVIVFAGVAHKLFCWIIDGFFTPRQ